MRIAALDVGSNSFHLIVVQVTSTGHFEVLDRAKEMVRLGEGSLRSGIIPPAVFKRGLEALATLRRLADRPQPDALRADTILAGAIVLRTALELTGSDEAVVSETALREGIVADYIVTHRPGILLVDEFPVLRRRCVMELARRGHFDEPHAQHVTRLALSLFDQTRELHELGEDDEELLEYAGLLHDIGFHISPSGHHKHAAYLIETAGMAGFSRDEVEVMALTARYHRKAEPPARRPRATVRRHPTICALSRKTRKRVRYLAALLRLADALDRTHGRLVRAVRCQIKRKTIELRLEVEGDPELELWAARRKGDALETLTGLRLRLAVDAVTRVRPATVTAALPATLPAAKPAPRGRVKKPSPAAAGGVRAAIARRLRLVG